MVKISENGGFYIVVSPVDYDLREVSYFQLLVQNSEQISRNKYLPANDGQIEVNAKSRKKVEVKFGEL